MRTGITCIVTRLFMPGNVPFSVFCRKIVTELYPKAYRHPPDLRTNCQRPLAANYNLPHKGSVEF